MEDTHFYEPAHGHGLAHDPFKSIVAPRPIGWVSTVDREGRVNLAPYSFFNAIGERPPMLAFSSVGRKDSIANAEATGEFVWNLVTRPLAEAMNETSRPLPHEVNEMAFAGIEAAASKRVRPPRVKAATAMECRVLQILHLRDLEGAETDQHLVIGQVVGVHIARDHLRDGVYDILLARPVARCGGPGDYAEVDHLFDLRRPK